MIPYKFDVAIIGAGHNGLTSAAYLAASGLNVVVLERNGVVGGAAVTEEFAPGFSNSVASYTVSLLNPKVIADLDLHRHGLEIIERPAANFWPVDSTRSLLVTYDPIARRKGFASFSSRDAERLDAYDNELTRAVAVLRDLITRTPPNAGGGILELIKAGGIGRRVLNLSIADQRLLLELFTASAADFLDRRFENETVKAAFAFDGIVGAYAAPSTPGTAYMLHHCFGEVNVNLTVLKRRRGRDHASDGPIGGARRSYWRQCAGERSRKGRYWTRAEVRRARASARDRANIGPARFIASDIDRNARTLSRSRPVRHVPHERGARGAAGFRMQAGEELAPHHGAGVSTIS